MQDLARRIPGEAASKPSPMRTTASWSCILEGEEVPEDDDQARPSARRPSLSAWCPSPAAPPIRTRAFRNCWTPLSTYMPSPLDKKAITGINPKTDEEDIRPVSDDDALLRPGLQDRDRPVSSASCASSVFIPARLDKGSTVLNSTKGTPGAPGPHPADARQPPGGHRHGLLRRYRRRRRPEEHHHRRHPVR